MYVKNVAVLRTAFALMLICCTYYIWEGRFNRILPSGVSHRLLLETFFITFWCKPQVIVGDILQEKNVSYEAGLYGICWNKGMTVHCTRSIFFISF